MSVQLSAALFSAAPRAKDILQYSSVVELILKTVTIELIFIL
jgi:hypothetical protein